MIYFYKYDNVRRRLVLTPAGHPITHAASPLEVITCLLDLVLGKDPISRSDVVPHHSAAHKEIWSCGILHRDVSINNSMMYEETLPDGTVRVRELLIDFDYMIRVDRSNRTARPGDRTVSPVNQYHWNTHNTDRQHTPIYGYRTSLCC